MHDDTPIPVSGQLLVANFQTAFLNIATTTVAEHEATRSEAALEDHLAALSGGMYLQPGNLDEGTQHDISRESLDAHIKKIQARQLSALSDAQLEELVTQTKATYQSRKVKVTVLDATNSPLEYIWFNPHTGYRTSTSKKLSVTGTIEEIRLEDNVLLLRPSFWARLPNRELTSYAVYVIDPDTLVPMIELVLI